MDSKSLMIGDWVYMPNDEGVLTPMQIESFYFDALFADGCEHYAEDCSPIPLTAEILEKNGFAIEEREGDITFPYFAFIIENDEYRVEITWYDSHDVYEPNTGKYLRSAPEVWNIEILSKCGNYDCGKNKIFVHELQRALRLCGIDKEIVL